MNVENQTKVFEFEAMLIVNIVALPFCLAALAVYLYNITF